jgi:hypothetical protein
MIIRTMFGPFLSVPSRLFMQSLHTFGNMLSCTLVLPYDSFNVIIVASLIILPIKISFSLVAFFFVFLVYTHLLKMAN